MKTVYWICLSSGLAVAACNNEGSNDGQHDADDSSADNLDGGGSDAGGSSTDNAADGSGASTVSGGASADGGSEAGGTSGDDDAAGGEASSGGTGSGDGGRSGGGGQISAGGSTSSGGASIEIDELTPEELEAALAAPKQEFRFHHVHVNAANPEGSVAFYVQHFEAVDLAWSGSSKAARSGPHWLVFDLDETSPAPSELTSALFHIGLGVDEVEQAHDALVMAGVESEEAPFHVSSRLCTGSPGTPNVAFLYGPDHEVFEINVASGPNFRHLHLLSADPNQVGAWYVEHVGVTSATANPSEAINFCNDIQISPIYGGNLDGVQLLWYPMEFSQGFYPNEWAGKDDLDPQRGRAFDHIAFSVGDLDRAVTRLRAEGVTVAQFPEMTLGEQLRSAFIVGPDHVEIEIVEGHIE